MKQLPKFIEGLVKDGKLKNSIDRDIKVDWPWTKIAGPCSVEGPSIIEISKEIKKCGANAFRAGAYKPCTFPIIEEKNDVSLQITQISNQMKYRKNPEQKRAKIKEMKT